MAAVTPRRMVGTAWAPAATTRSQPRISRAPPAASRGAPISAWVGAIFRWVRTAPPFWAMPIMSRAATPLPSRWAAMPSRAATVITPVPPTPVTRMP